MSIVINNRCWPRREWTSWVEWYVWAHHAHNTHEPDKTRRLAMDRVFQNGASLASEVSNLNNNGWESLTNATWDSKLTFQPGFGDPVSWISRLWRGFSLHGEIEVIHQCSMHLKVTLFCWLGVSTVRRAGDELTVISQTNTWSTHLLIRVA